jgi:hypothetical protein
MSDMAITKDKAGVPVRLKVQREVARLSEGFYEEASQLAERVRQAKLKTDQVRGLENIAYSTDKVSDILDLVKKQIGRGRWPLDVGEDILAALGQRQAEAKRIAKSINVADDDLPRQAHLLLCREYVKHLAAHFVYQRQVYGEEESGQ